ncbi:MAG: hypothetical protein IT373_27985 [Polyangiaceae bacterium]|nr:hypothetical protein [Polyangiaceae bacterium]
MDVVALAVAAVAALLAFVALGKVLGAERRAASLEERLARLEKARARLEEAPGKKPRPAADKPAGDKALAPPKQKAEPPPAKAEPALTKPEPAAAKATQPDPAPQKRVRDELKSTRPETPAATKQKAPEPAADDPAVVARAEAMFEAARAIAVHAGFDFQVMVGSEEGGRVSVEVKDELDRKAVAHLQKHEKRLLAVEQKPGGTYFVVRLRS